jgi:hypothetical protein
MHMEMSPSFFFSFLFLESYMCMHGELAATDAIVMATWWWGWVHDMKGAGVNCGGCCCRRLEAMGYKRSAKKCREKFENVDKYYKRTKDGRAGRGDGKAYRFFSELEALHGAAPAVASLARRPVAMAPAPPPPVTALVGASTGMAPTALHAEPPPMPQPAAPAPTGTGTGTGTGSVTATIAPPAGAAASDAAAAAACMMTPGDVSFSSGSDGEDTDETGGGSGKRKRDGGEDEDGFGGSISSKMMRFFEGLMRQVMERQEEMQRRFIEAIERREQDRMIREEAWRRQEVARLAREQDALAQERAMAVSRDAAVVSFIQRVTGQNIPMPVPSPVAPPPAFITALTHAPPLQPTPVASAAPAAPAPAQAQHQPPPPAHQLSPKKPQTVMPLTPQAPQQPQVQPRQAPSPSPSPATHPQGNKEIVVRAPPPAESQDTAGFGGGAPSPSRWPKAEVHALIQLRTEMETRYQDSGPKGPLWEDISSGMRRLGYNRSAKRCKEKWENINKYFKKVKESNKKRPEDSKTCPYYHQLDALYRSKALASSSSGPGAAPALPPPPPPPQRPDQQAAAAAPPVTVVLAPVPLSQTGPHGNGNGNGNGCAGRGSSDNGGGGSGGMQKQQASNGGVAAARFSAVDGAGGNGVATNKVIDRSSSVHGVVISTLLAIRSDRSGQLLIIACMLPYCMLLQREEGIVRKEEAVAAETRPQPVSMNDSYVDSDSSMDDDEEDDFYDDDDEGDVGDGGNSKMQYEIQFQQQHQHVQPQQQQNQSGGGVRPNASGSAGAGAGPAATTSGSFLTMVHH